MDLPARFLLLSTKDRSGRPFGYHTYGFGAAVLAELLLEGNLALQGGRVRATAPPADEAYLPLWRAIAADKPRKPKKWVERAAGRRYRGIRRSVTNRLLEAGVLREQQGSGRAFLHGTRRRRRCCGSRSWTPSTAG